MKPPRTPRESFATLPNVITSLRALSGAPVVVLLVYGESWALWTALGVMILAEASDWLDGAIARRRGQTTKIGKILDPMADSLYRVSVFGAFAANHWMPLWMLLVVVLRDVSVSYLRVLAEENTGTLGARQSGKWKAVAQGFAQVTVVAVYAAWGADLSDAARTALTVILAFAVLVTAYSLVDYAWSVVHAMRRGEFDENGRRADGRASSRSAASLAARGAENGAATYRD